MEDVISISYYNLFFLCFWCLNLIIGVDNRFVGDVDIRFVGDLRECSRVIGDVYLLLLLIYDE